MKSAERALRDARETGVPTSAPTSSEQQEHERQVEEELRQKIIEINGSSHRISYARKCNYPPHVHRGVYDFILNFYVLSKNQQEQLVKTIIDLSKVDTLSFFPYATIMLKMAVGDPDTESMVLSALANAKSSLSKEGLHKLMTFVAEYPASNSFKEKALAALNHSSSTEGEEMDWTSNTDKAESFKRPNDFSDNSGGLPPSKRPHIE